MIMRLFVLSRVLNSTGSYLTLKVIGEQPVGAGMVGLQHPQSRIGNVESRIDIEGHLPWSNNRQC